MPESGNTVLDIKNITKRFGSLTASDNVSLTLAKGEVLALLGENGAGKTTLMNILFGHYVADEGSIEVFGKPLAPGSPGDAIAAGVGMVHQHFTLAENLTVLENITLGTQPLFALRRRNRRAKQRIQDLSEQFGLKVSPGARVRDLSVGERQRVEILKALYRDARILILDEPTAVLSPQESEGLFRTLKKFVDKGLSIIFISHKLPEIMAVSDRVTVLRAGKTVFSANTAETSREALAEAMVAGSVTPPVRIPMPHGEPLLSLDGVSVKGEDGELRLDSASLTLHENEVLGIAGVSGNGQAALAELIAGLATPHSGAFTVKGESVTRCSPRLMRKKGIGAIPEDRQSTGLVGDMNIWENLSYNRYREKGFSMGGLLRLSALKDFAKERVAAFDVRCGKLSDPVRLLSGGNMQKLIVARVLAENPEMILANQPTWGLDIGAAAFVHERLLAARERGAGVLLISEDLEEIMRLADRVRVICGGRLSEPMETRNIDPVRLGLLMTGEKGQENEI